MKNKLVAKLLAGLLLVGLAIYSVFLENLQVLLLDAPEHPPEPRGLTVHFLDVGQADCALLECGGEFLLIDGGNVDDGRLVVSYLEQLGVEQLQTVICTHAHEDHAGGLAAVLAVFPTERVYCPTRTDSSRYFENFLKYVDQQRLEITLPVPGDSFSLGGARVTILGPVRSYPETNDTSIVCRVDFGENSFLFTGDMEKTAETDLVESGAFLSCDVLKMGHHGSDTSTGYWFLREVDPEYTLISVGAGNSYGHPHEEPMSRLRHQGTVVLRTDRLGTVLAHCDGTDITFTWENQKAFPENVIYTGIYIGNSKSLRLHSQECGSLPGGKNRVEFATIQEALDAGYTPCASCIG